MFLLLVSLGRYAIFIVSTHTTRQNGVHVRHTVCARRSIVYSIANTYDTYVISQIKSYLTSVMPIILRHRRHMDISRRGVGADSLCKISARHS